MVVCVFTKGKAIDTAKAVNILDNRTNVDSVAGFPPNFSVTTTEAVATEHMEQSIALMPISLPSGMKRK